VRPTSWPSESSAELTARFYTSRGWSVPLTGVAREIVTGPHSLVGRARSARLGHER
jgi:hypothetical protein